MQEHTTITIIVLKSGRMGPAGERLLTSPSTSGKVLAECICQGTINTHLQDAYLSFPDRYRRKMFYGKL